MKNNIFPFFQKMKQYFIKRGKKNTIEKLFHSFLIHRAEMKRTDFYAILSNAMFNSTPYIKLKMRKRGRKIRYKINLIEEKGWKERKALGGISKVLRNHSENKFILGFEKELSLLHKGKSTVQAKRDEYHNLVLKTMPFFWSKKSKKKKKKIKHWKPRNIFVKGDRYFRFKNQKFWIKKENQINKKIYKSL